MFFAVFGLKSSARAQVDDLLKKVPMFSNAIVVIDVDSVIKSPLAIKEKWASKLDAAAASRPIVLPPEASRIVIASHLTPREALQADWELAVMDLKEPISMRSIARAEGGYVDSINGLEAAWTPSNAYFVSLGDQSMGMMYPANRQYVSRWADFARKNPGVAISDYLQRTAYSLGQTGQIVMGFDLKDMVQPHRLNETLDKSPALAKAKADLGAVVPVLASLQGVMLSINVGEKAHGILRVDFGQNVAPLKGVAKPLFLEALDKWGAAISDFENWQVTVGDTYIKLEGDLSTNGLRRIFSILEMPTTKFHTLSDQMNENTPQSQTASDSLVAQSSLAYYKSVNTLIEDLQSGIKGNRDNRVAWMERYAKKIDRLPILNVDDILLTFGSNVAESFRDMAIASRGAGIQAGVRKSSVYSEYYYSGTNYAFPGDTYYGYGSTRSEARVKNQIDREEQAKFQEMRFTTFKEIEDQSAKMRIEMTKKYMLQF
jgi:hypothetical protein